MLFNKRKNYMVKLKLFFGIIILSVSILTAQVRDAEFKIHNRGNLWETMKDDGTIGAPDPTNRFETYPSMDWPGGPTVLSKNDQRSYLYSSGLWIGGKKDGNLFFTEHGPFTFVDNGEFEPIELKNNFIGSSDYNPSEAEQIITSKFKSTENITVQRTSRVWSFRDINNIVLIEYEFTNSFNTSMNEVYFGFPYLIRPSYQDFVVHNGWGDDFNRTDDYVRYDETLKLLYSYDNTPNFSYPTDVGNYLVDQNELRTTGYAGFSLVYNDPVTDNSEQPTNVLFAQLLNNEQKFTTQSSSKENLYKILIGQDKSLQADTSEHLTPFMLMSVGPYNLSSGEKIKIVVVEAVNGISQEDALKGLASQSLLYKGEDMLKTSVQNAKDLFANNYKVEDLPTPSPEIEIIAVPENQSISLSWEPVEDTWVDPLEGKSNLLQYAIYRSSKSFIGPYQFLKKIKPTKATDLRRYYQADINKWVYEDRTISLGAGYYYAVTSIDSNGVESWLTNRNEKAIFATKKPVENVLNVKVFPNPFKEVSGFPISGQENSIVWTNLPSKCTIRVYTSNGELVKEMEHDNEFSGEEIWTQLSNARQRTAPGIYFWTVESTVGNAKGTLLIIK